MTTKEFFSTSSIFILSIIILSIPIIILVSSTTDNFSATATVSNSPPTIAIDAAQTITGQSAGSKLVNISFNATDSNGWSSLNDSTAKISINKTGEATRNSTGCTAVSHPSSTSTIYNCTITLWYFDAPGTWTINASINDTANNFVQNSSQTATVSNLDAVAAVAASISFTGAPGSTNNAASPLQQLNNTGNQNYVNINITGYSFTSGANVISVGNVTVNTSNSGGLGQTLINNTMLQINNSALNRGNNSKTSLYFWLNIPIGTPGGSYTSQSNWILQAN